MRRLILFRHAKSAWGDPSAPDHDRPLNRRGRLAAPVMGAWLAGLGLTPDRALCSTSARTVETWARARRAMAGAPDPELSPALYLADPATLLELVRETPARVRTLLVLGHNPGLQSFARQLSGGGGAAAAPAFDRFPTAAVAVFDLGGEDWSALRLGAAAFTRFATPKGLV